jgi:hypothetical protein
MVKSEREFAAHIKQMLQREFAYLRHETARGACNNALHITSNIAKFAGEYARTATRARKEVDAFRITERALKVFKTSCRVEPKRGRTSA